MDLKKTGRLCLSHLLLLFIVINLTSPTLGQRSLLHWKRDLEYRLNSYLNQRETIGNIVSSSIHSTQDPPLGARKLFTARNVRFSDLIIPTGALVLDPQVARPTVRILMNKTRGYVNNKMNELYQIRNQLETIKRQVDDPRQPYINKGQPGGGPQQTVSLNGTWIFKQFVYGHVLSSDQVEVKQINYTDVDHVINETYMANLKFNLLDSRSRLYFEGRKTFWNTLFSGTLKSGCCDRLKPLDTSRMMLKSTNQSIMAPVMFRTGDLYGKESVYVDHLDTNQFSNRLLVVNPTNPKRYDDLVLSPSQFENPIQMNSLIPINRPFDLELPKTIVFKERVFIGEAYLSASPMVPGNKLLIGFAWNKNMPSFDLSHENYLLRTGPPKQRVPGTVIINAESHFLTPIEAVAVNGITNFRKFALESLVRVDRPATIRGPVQFNTLPAIFGGPSPSVVMMQVDKGLRVDLVNGMRLPQDLVLLPPNALARAPHEPIVVHGPRHFADKLKANHLMQVDQLINGLRMPDDVIPLHLNDFMASVGRSNLWFLDGIFANHVTIQSGYLDDINLRGAHIDAQNLIMNSVFSNQPDGTQLIRAPLRVNHLKLFGDIEGKRGLLNGFRPQNLLELQRTPMIDDIIRGKKTFQQQVDVQECIIGNINGLPNWPNHLIRIDRPGTVQTVHTRLAFGQPNGGNPNRYTGLSTMTVQDLRVEFYPNNNERNYLSNWNLSPEFLILHQALATESANHTIGRYRVMDRVRLSGRVNNVPLDDIVTLDKPFRFADRFVLVGKVEVFGNMFANRITSNYPLDAMDLVQFDKFRIPILGSMAPIRLSNLVLAGNNQASFVNCRMLNGITFDEFANSIMSLTRPQTIDSGLVFNAQVNLEGLVRTGSSVNSIKNFSSFAGNLRSARYSFEDGLQCNAVVINSNKYA